MAKEKGGKALLLLGEERGGGKRFRSRDKTTEEEGREGNGAFFATAGVKVKKKKMARRIKGGRGQVGTHLGVLKFFRTLYYIFLKKRNTYSCVNPLHKNFLGDIFRLKKSSF